MADLPGLRLVRPSDVETMVFDWGTIKWMSEPRVTHTSGFTMGVVLLEPGKGHERHSLIECKGRPGADGSLGGQPRVGDDDVRSRPCHCLRLFFIKHIGTSQQPHLARLVDHLHLKVIAHPGLFQVRPENSVY